MNWCARKRRKTDWCFSFAANPERFKPASLSALAARNRAWFAGREILALNLVSSPGAGKTTLLERTIRDLKGEMSIYVVEGDQATANDGLR